MSMNAALSLVSGLAVAAGGGWLFNVLGVPLAWILGALAGSAVFTNVFGQQGRTRHVRRAGQLLLGTATAGVLTPDILQIMAGLLPAMIGAAIASNVIGLILAFPLRRLAGTDQLTALLCSLPAGMAEMSSLAREVGARADIVTIVHTLRVILVVFLVPAIVGVTSSAVITGAPNGGTYMALTICLTGGFLLALIASRLKLLNPFIIMPMVMGVTFVAAGFPIAQMPAPLLVAAQIFIGFSLGTRLRRENFMSLPRAAIAGAVTSLALILAMAFIMAPLIVRFTDTDMLSVLLGTAPGGLGEMIASAKVVGASAAIVAGYQFVRSFLTNMIVPQLVVKFGAPKAGDT